MSSLFGSGEGQPISTQATRANGIQVQTSSYGKGVAIVYGRTRIPGALIWYGDFQAVQHQQQTGKGGGGNASVSYTYSSSFALALCEGPITKVGTIWHGSGTTSLSDINGTVMLGTPGEAPWSHWTGGDALNYPYIAYIGCLNLKLGSSPNVPNLNFEVFGLLPFSSTIDDSEPSAILTDLLTNIQHGLGFSSMGDLTQYRDYCVAHGLFISPVLRQERPLTSVVKELLTITNSTALWSGGALRIIPYGTDTVTANGATYTPDTTIRFDLGPDDFLKPLVSERKPLADLPNTLRIEFLDGSKNFVTSVAEVKDQSDIDSRGVRSLKTIQAHAITSGALAKKAGQTILQRSLYIRNTFRTEIPLSYIALEPGDIITLTDPLAGLNKEPVRVTSISESDDLKLAIVAEEFPAGVAEAASYPIEANAGYIPNTHGAPDTTATPIFFRAPQFLAGAAGVWIGATGAGPNWGGAHVWASYDDIHYSQIGTIAPGCRYGTVSAALATTAVDPDVTNSFGVALEGPGQLNGGTQQDADEMVTQILVDAELVAYETAVLNADGTYTLGNGYLRRGCYGTAFAPHAIGAPWLRIDGNFFSWTFDPGNVGTTVYLKFQAYNLYGGGAEDISAVPAYTYVIGSGDEIPDTPPVPTNFSAGGTANGIKLSWSNPNPASVAMSSVEYSTDGTTWALLGQTQGEEYTHHFSGNTTYYYRVRSRSAAFIWSAYTTVISSGGGSLDHVPDGSTYVRPLGSYLDTGRPWALWRPTGAVQVGADDLSKHSEVTQHIGGLGIPDLDLAGTKIANKIGTNIKRSATDSTLLDRAFTKGAVTDPDTIDSVPDGTLHGKSLLTYLDTGRPKALWRPAGLVSVGADDISKHSEVTQHIGGLGVATVNLDSQVASGTNFHRVGAGYADDSGRINNLWRTTGIVSAADISKHSEVTQHIGGLGIGTVDFAGKVTGRTADKMTYTTGGTVDSLMPAEAGANPTASHTAAAIAGQGALATKSAVDLSTAEVTNKTAANIKFTAAGTPTVDSLMPAEVGANITASHQSATTAALTGHTQDDLPDGTNSLQWRKVQQDALFSGGENQLLDPGLTSIAFWSHAPLSNGTIGGQTLAAGANQYISQHDGHGSLKYLRVSAGQSISVSYDLVTAGTGDAVAVFYVILQDTTGGVLQYVIPPNTFGTPPFSRVLTAPTGTVRGLVLWNFGASTFGGTAPVLSNPVVRLGSQTVIDAGGAKGYIDFGDDTTNGHVSKNQDNIADGLTYARPLGTALTSGQVDLGKAGVINKTLQHLQDYPAGGRYAAMTAKADATNATICGAGSAIQVALCYDGVPVTFASAFASPPIIIPAGGGGLNFSTVLGTTKDQYQQFQASVITATGFTPILKLKTLASVTAASQNFSPYNTLTTSASLTLTTAAVDGNYTVNFSLLIPPQQTTVVASIIMNGTTIWSHSYLNASSITKFLSILVTDTALTAGQTVTVTASNASSITATNMKYNTGVAPTSISATPSGTPGVPFLIYPPTT